MVSVEDGYSSLSEDKRRIRLHYIIELSAELGRIREAHSQDARIDRVLLRKGEDAIEYLIMGWWKLFRNARKCLTFKTVLDPRIGEVYSPVWVRFTELMQEAMKVEFEKWREVNPLLYDSLIGNR